MRILGQRLFGGTRRNASLIDGTTVVTHGGVLEPIIGVCDFPFSLALDAALFPVTLVFTIARSGQPRLVIPPSKP